LLVKILEHHWDEINAVPELSKALIAQGLRTASPATLRQQAAISRELRNVDLADDLEELANERVVTTWNRLRFAAFRFESNPRPA
jgi:hypothetical protein